MDIDRDIGLERDDREQQRELPTTSERSREDERENRIHRDVRCGHRVYSISPYEREAMYDMGRFRVVKSEDLADLKYRGKQSLMDQDMRSLMAQGLIQRKTEWTGKSGEVNTFWTMTKEGKRFLQKQYPVPKGQALYTGFVKPKELSHDAAIYPMFHREAALIEKDGGRVNRVILDYELKKKAYSPLAKAKTLGDAEYARRQAEIARQFSLKVVKGHILLPDLRIEYVDRHGVAAHVDLEVATQNYHGSHAAGKAAAGFRIYASSETAARLSRALEEREITADILSFKEDDMTNIERIQALMGFGYTEREAAFLCIAALHGGFFLRRQYSQFTGTAPGGADTVLIDKMLARGHAGALLGCQKAVVYHISARPFYNAIGQENNRNRRMRSTDAVKSRLMGIDYILEHPGRQYMATEEEKIAYFNGTLGIDFKDLPQKLFCSPNTKEATLRYFVDKYPIYPCEDATDSPLVGFSYIDEGAATLSHFEAYLAQYRELFSHVRGFGLDYVAASRNLLWEAEQRFNRFVSGVPVDNPVDPTELDLARLLSFFRDRQEYDAGPGPSFDRAKLIRFRDERLEFAGRFFEPLYNVWKANGEDAVEAAIDLERASIKPLNGRFAACLLKHNYDLFGVVTKAKEALLRADQG